MLVAKVDFVFENKDFPGNQQARVGNLGQAINGNPFLFQLAVADVSNRQSIFELNGVNAPPRLA